MWISRAALAARNARVDARIKELENIICPAEQHDFVVAGETMHIIDGFGTTIYERHYVCKRCLKRMTKNEYV